MDIVIYTNSKTLSKKKSNGIYDWHHWTFSRMPQKIDEFDRIYFACNGEIQGSFLAENINDDKKEIGWYWNTWVKSKGKMPCKQFRGFRYKWW